MNKRKPSFNLPESREDKNWPDNKKEMKEMVEEYYGTKIKPDKNLTKIYEQYKVGKYLSGPERNYLKKKGIIKGR